WTQQPDRSDVRCATSSTSNGDWFSCPGTRRIGREPLELSRRPRATNTGKRIEHVATVRTRRLRRAQLPQPRDILAVRAGERLVMQIRHDLGLGCAVLRQLAAGAHPAACVHVDALEGERLAGRFGAV